MENWFVTVVYTALGAAVVVPILAIVVPIVRQYRRVSRQNARFVAGALTKDLVPGTPATLTFCPRGSTQHALWLDLEVADGTSRLAFAVDAVVTADGADLRREQASVEAAGYDDFEWKGLPPEGSCSLGRTVTNSPWGARFSGLQRFLVFTPPPGAASVEVRVTFTPAADTTCKRSRIVVTPSPEP